MNRRRPDLSAGPSPSLGGLLRRAHMTLALAAVAFVGLVLAIPAIATLHFYAEHDLRLLGRAIGQTVEAAVVFADAEAAQDALARIVTGEDVAEASVISGNGQVVLARWQQASDGWRARLEAGAARLLHLRPALLPVVHDGAVVGQVELRGGGRTLLRAMAAGVMCILACQALIALGALWLSNRILGRIVLPLRTLAGIAGTVQRERAFGQRVPVAGIKELNHLGQAFNGLLAELDSWHAVMEGENKRLSHQASHDSLTGLPNRAFFEGRLDRALIDARLGGTSVAVMMTDCDKFKQINDEHGHAAGDAVLVGVAARLKGQFRESDLVARLGGDEFAILLAPSPDAAVLRTLAETVGLRIPVGVPGGASVTAWLSVGVAVFPDHAEDAASLLQRADEAMYRAKRASLGRPAS